MAGINVGSVVSLKGQWAYDSRYGKQFNVRHFTEAIPATVAGIEKYLGSGLIKGIGPVTSRMIVRRFREDTIRIIEEEPQRLTEVEGIGSKRLEMIKQAWDEHKEIRNVMLFLREYDVSPTYAVKIFKAYGKDSIRLVRENPFRLADDIWGIGFKTADRIAARMGYDQHSYSRCRAGIIYVLGQASGEGHCYLRYEQLLKAAVELLETEESVIAEALQKMIEEKTVIRDDGDAIYVPSLYFSEVGVARKIRDIAAAPNWLGVVGIDEIIKQVQKENRIEYDAAQIEAIKTAAASKFWF